jgi:hypothetical protein
MAAALMMSNLQAAVRSRASETMSPRMMCHDVLEKGLDSVATALGRNRDTRIDSRAERIVDGRFQR